MLSRDTVLGLAGALRLLRLDPRGVDFFEESDQAIWHSFRAYLLVLPITLGLSFLLGDPALPVLGWPLYAALEAAKMAVNVAGFLLVACHLASAMGHGGRIGTMVVAYNWSQLVSVLIYGLFIVVAASLGGGPGQKETTLGLMVPMLWLLVYGWFVLRQSLACGGLLASTLLLTDVTINLLISSATTVS